MTETLTGSWIGRYDYGGDAPVPFEAQMVQDGTALTATTVEPNTFHSGAATELTGRLTGWIVGDEVRLTKTYSFDQGDDPEYVGRIDPDHRRIAGRWHFRSWIALSGDFFMIRKPEVAARADRRATVEA